MSKLHRVDANNRAFYCPGCEAAHVIPVAGPHAWGWNSNEDKPTFNPSILVHDHRWTDDNGKVRGHRCHSFVRDGRIMFLLDCTHTMAGRTVELSEWEGHEVWD